MKIIEKEIMWAGHSLTLTNERAVYWSAENTLILSDIHLGKAAHFRKNGIPMTSLIHQGDLKRLEIILCHFKPTKVVIVGDLIHAGENSEVLQLTAFRQRFAETQFVLVRGNHDRMQEYKLYALGIDAIEDVLVLNGLEFVHQPTECSPLPQVCGHEHPGVSMKFLRTRKRFPAYLVNHNRLVLPAFSNFTGLDTKFTMPDAIYHAFYEDGFFEVVAGC